MRLCGVFSAPPEARLALDLYTPTGDMLLRAGTPLTPAHRQALWRRGIVCVVVEDRESQGISVWPLVSSQVRVQALRTLVRLAAPLEQTRTPGPDPDRAGRRLPGALPVGELGATLDRLLQEVLADPLVGAGQGRWLLGHLVETIALTVLLTGAWGSGRRPAGPFSPAWGCCGCHQLCGRSRGHPGRCAHTGLAASLWDGPCCTRPSRTLYGRTLSPGSITSARMRPAIPRGLRGWGRWTEPEHGRRGCIHPSAERSWRRPRSVSPRCPTTPTAGGIPREAARGLLRRLAGSALNREIVETLLVPTALFPAGTLVRVGDRDAARLVGASPG